jgi:hypothetical protein
MNSEPKKPIFDQVDDLHKAQVQFSGKTNSESETKKEEGWN